MKAYRKLAQRWHPDNFQATEEKKRAEKKFIDIAQAKEVLTDPGTSLSLSWLQVYGGAGEQTLYVPSLKIGVNLYNFNPL